MVTSLLKKLNLNFLSKLSVMGAIQSFNKMPQGLGTGSLFTNNFESPLEVKKGALFYNTNTSWNFNL